jgi:hypothetical protein
MFICMLVCMSVCARMCGWGGGHRGGGGVCVRVNLHLTGRFPRKTHTHTHTFTHLHSRRTCRDALRFEMAALITSLVLRTLQGGDADGYAYAQQAYMSGGYEAYAAYGGQTAYDPSLYGMDPSQYGSYPTSAHMQHPSQHVTQVWSEVTGTACDTGLELPVQHVTQV